VKVVPVSGATEIAPHLGIADIIVDLTSTGSTLKMNGLREVGTVVQSSARLIARKITRPRRRRRWTSCGRRWARCWRPGASAT
jgi:ATP phosphoribosyltransferase